MNQNLSETGGMPENVNDLEKVRADLRGPGAVSFNWIRQVLAKENLREEEKRTFLDLVTAKMEHTMSGGISATWPEQRTCWLFSASQISKSRTNGPAALRKCTRDFPRAFW